MARILVLACLALACAVLTAAGGLLVGLGAVFVLDGEAFPGIFSLATGALVLYGAYLFGRATWRTRRLTIAGGRVRAILAGCLVTAVAMVASTGRTETTVIALAALVLVLPLVFAQEFEPPKRRPRQR